MIWDMNSDHREFETSRELDATSTRRGVGVYQLSPRNSTIFFGSDGRDICMRETDIISCTFWIYLVMNAGHETTVVLTTSPREDSAALMI